MAYQAPRQRRRSRPAAVSAVFALEVAAFLSSGRLIAPSPAEGGRHLRAGLLGVEVATTLGALVAVALLLRHEVRDSVAKVAPGGSPPGALERI